MLPFLEEHRPWILNRVKDMTRRRWKKRRAVPGSIHYAQISQWRPETRFARLKVLEVYQEALKDMTDEDARREGPYKNLEEFRGIWIKLYGVWDPEEVVWVVVFQIYEDLITGTLAPNGKLHQHGGWKCSLCGAENDRYQDRLEDHLIMTHELNLAEARVLAETADPIPLFLQSLSNLSKKYNVLIEGIPVLSPVKEARGKYENCGMLRWIK